MSLDSTEQSQINKLAHDLEVLFTRYTPKQGDLYEVNRQLALHDGFSTKQISDLELTVKAMNQLTEYSYELDYNHGYMTRGFNSNKFAIYLAESALGIPASALMSGSWMTIVNAISAWNWGLAVSTIARALAPAFTSLETWFIITGIDVITTIRYPYASLRYTN